MSSARNISNNYRKELLDTGLNDLKTASKKLIHKAAEAVAKPKPVIDEDSRDVQKIIIPSERREEILNELREIFQKWNTVTYLNY